jgi:hypothetical protein
MGSKMTNVMIRVLCWLVSFFQHLQGHYSVEEVKHPKNFLGSLVGYSVSGYTIEIFCQRRQYRRSYVKWFIPDKDHISYHVYSRVSPEAPAILQQACELDLDIPALLPAFVPDSGQREEVVRAYLDILIQRLGPLRDLANEKNVKVSYQ